MKAIDDDLYLLRMDAAALPGEVILNRAISESRALTSVERAGVKIAKMERDDVWLEYSNARQAAGLRVSQWDQEYLNGKREKLVLKMPTESSHAKLFLYGEIGEQFLTAEDISKQLKAVPDSAPLELRVHSEGGDLFEAIAIHNLIKQRMGPTHGYVDSLAASGASLVLVACESVTMLRGSWQMLHGVQATLKGSRSAEEMQRFADRMRQHNDQLFAIYMQKWTGSEKQLRDALADELWLDEQQSVQLGMADHISDEVAIAAHIDAKKFKFRNVPQTLALSACAHRDCIQPRRQLAELGLHRTI